MIRLAKSADQDQIQPASLDLRLGAEAYRVRASFLPGPKTRVADKLKEIVLHRIDLSEGAVLETGCVYIVPLMESLKLQKGISAAANPKSSTGRLDIFTRVITKCWRRSSMKSCKNLAGFTCIDSGRTMPCMPAR